MASKRHVREKMCGNKLKYDTLEQAQRAADSIGSFNDRGTSGYLCDFCHKYHAGHKPRTNKRLSRHDVRN